jgi:hypothetical protein
MPFFADPRERALHPLLVKRTELLNARVEAVDKGETVNSSELERVEAEILAIRRDEHPDLELTQECHGGDCHEQLDIRKDAHYVLTLKSACKFDPTKPVGEQVTWIYPPNLADTVMCVECGDGLLARHDEQKVESIPALEAEHK